MDRSEDETMVRALQAGDEAAFRTLVARHTPLMRRVARSHVRSDAVADEVVQDAWLGVVRGLERFEGRSSLKTWILRIVVNRARSRGEREAHSVPFSALDDPDIEGDAVGADRFHGPEHPRWPGHWSAPPAPWPEDRLLARESAEAVLRAIRTLPPRQQQVIVLRDIEQWEADEVAEALGLSQGNQRVLLHRARTRVRAALEEAWTS